jgi:hypothetical protein
MLEILPAKAVTAMPTAQLVQPTSLPGLPTPFGHVRADSAKDEPPYDEQIADIAGRLRRRYTNEQISQADLENRVRGFYRQFDTARIRTFVAVFVERLVRRSIEQLMDQPSVVAAPSQG